MFVILVEMVAERMLKKHLRLFLSPTTRHEAFSI